MVPGSAGQGEGGEPPSGWCCLSWRVLSRALSLLQVFCDMETSGGGWTIIQRRKSGLVSFYRDWKQYKQGFGSIRGDFWLGNEHIHRLSRRPTRLRVEMEVSVGAGARGPDRGRHAPGVSFLCFSTAGWCTGCDSFPAGCSTVENRALFLAFTKARLQVHRKRPDSGQGRGVISWAEMPASLPQPGTPGPLDANLSGSGW